MAAARGPAYRILTERFCIRCPEPRDAEAQALAIAESREHLAAWMPWASQEPLPLAERVERLRRTRAHFDLDVDFAYLVLPRDESRVVGGCGLHTRIGEGAREIGYWAHVREVGRGQTTEVAAALTRVGFEVDGVERIEIHCDPKNAASAAVPRKLGYRHEATLAGRMRDPQGALRDTMIWTLFADAYPGSAAARQPVEAFDVLGNRLL